MKKLSIAALSLAFLITGCSSGAGSSNLDCESNSDCDPGEVCVDGGCNHLCNSDSQCASDMTCIQGVCQECSNCREVPSVYSIDGTGSPDGGTHADNHLTNALLINGTNLAGSSVVLSGGDYQSLELEHCTLSTDTQLLVQVPENFTEGSYTLHIANQAGSCDASITVLQGEEGLAGSYEIGTSSGTVAAGDDNRFHTPYTDTMAQTAMGALAADNPLNHAAYTDTETLLAIRNNPLNIVLSDNIITDWAFND
ncbi:hypothetical protein KAI87_04345, partial [Myxococcota bacterium]|nr:hypothetical protein [Myxococcota bacterium]